MSEQCLLVEKLKKSINIEQAQRSGLKSERSNSAMNNEQAEYNSKMAHMETEMSYYKEKLNRLNASGRAGASKNPNRQSEVENISQIVGQSTGSFHMQSTNQLYSDSIMSLKNVGEASASSAAMNTFASASTQKIKVSKKDLRRLTDEEMVKRSSQQSKNF